MYKHRNMQQCCKNILLIYIVHLLDKYNYVIIKFYKIHGAYIKISCAAFVRWAGLCRKERTKKVVIYTLYRGFKIIICQRCVN